MLDLCSLPDFAHPHKATQSVMSRDVIFLYGKWNISVRLTDVTQKNPETCIFLGLLWEARQDASWHLEIILDVVLFVCVCA